MPFSLASERVRADSSAAPCADQKFYKMNDAHGSRLDLRVER